MGVVRVVPDPQIVLTGEQELKRMDAERDRLGHPRLETGETR